MLMLGLGDHVMSQQKLSASRLHLQPDHMPYSLVPGTSTGTVNGCIAFQACGMQDEHRQLQLPFFAADCQAGNGKIDEVYSICFTKQNHATFWV